MRKNAKLLIVGLGNPGNEYIQTRHNIGFQVLDSLSKRLNVSLEFNKRLNANVGFKTVKFQNYDQVRDQVLQRERERIYNRMKHEQLLQGVSPEELQLPKTLQELIVDESVVNQKVERLVYFPEVEVHLMKPQTYMNLSGGPVRLYMDANAMKTSHLAKLHRVLVVADDVHHTFGTIKLRYKGGAGGHNGLADVEKKLGTEKYHRLKMGIAPRELYTPNLRTYVLEKFNPEERNDMPTFISNACDLIISEYIHQEPKLTSNNGTREI